MESEKNIKRINRTLMRRKKDLEVACANLSLYTTDDCKFLIYMCVYIYELFLFLFLFFTIYQRQECT